MIRTASGPTACTHGPDPSPSGADVRHRASLAQLRARARSGRRRLSAAPALQCSGNGSYAVQAIYAHVSGQPDNYSTYLPLLQAYAEDVEAVFSSSAAETGGSRGVQFVTDRSCQLSVIDVAVSTGAAGSFNTMITELQQMGYRDSSRKYLVWMDNSNAYCGIGQYYVDWAPGQDNYNNGNPAVPGMFARVDQPCWGRLNIGHSVEAHELTHTFGAVADSAPNGTPSGHCTDEYDTMCYRDDQNTVLRFLCPPSHEALLDCNHDDYFSTNPAPGSWLANHWNTADNVFLTAGGGPPPPPPPPAPPPPSVDVQAPLVQAYDSSGKRGKLVNLNFRVYDDSGFASRQIWIYKGEHSLATLAARGTATGGREHATWKAPKKRARLKFCVLAWDAASNRSPTSCASLRIN